MLASNHDKRIWTHESIIRGHHVYKDTSKKFTKTIVRWIDDEEKLKIAKKGSKRTITARKAVFPENGG
jgi:hypothetical protein